MILGGHFDVDAKDKRIKELEDILNQPNIWNDNVYASKVNNELINLKLKIVKVIINLLYNGIQSRKKRKGKSDVPQIRVYIKRVIRPAGFEPET